MYLALRILSLAAMIIVVSSCKSTNLDDSKLKDAVFQIDNRFILLTGNDSGKITIKECDSQKRVENNGFNNGMPPEDKDTVEQFNKIRASRDCERLPGTLIRTMDVFVLVNALLENSGLMNFPQNSNMYESLNFLQKYNISTDKFRDEYKKSVVEAEEKLKQFREMVLAFGDDPYIPSSEKFQRSLEEIKRIPENARSQLIDKLQIEIDILSQAMRNIFQTASQKSEMILIGKSKSVAGNLFAFNLLEAFVSKPEVDFEFVEVLPRNQGTPMTVDPKTNKPSLLTFKMGANENGQDFSPEHDAMLMRPYQMQTTEVTQAQWFDIMGANPSFHKGAKYCQNYDPKKDICPNMPVESVSWDEVEVFIGKLNQAHARKLNLDSSMYALPTEAEWEFAARGGRQSTEPGTTFFKSKSDLLKFAWTQENSALSKITDLSPRSVAMLKRNPLGLFDIYGNVWEWTADIYAPNSYSNPNVDPQNPKRSLRGGSFYIGGEFSNSVVRRGLEKKSSDRRTGFRLIKVPADETQRNNQQNQNNFQQQDNFNSDFDVGSPV